MTEALLLIPTAILGYLLWRADRRFDEAEKAWRLERTGLLTRIQAPELAATLAGDIEPSDEPLYVPYEDDAAWQQFAERKAAGEVS
jgi:hypothetical protein